MISHSEQRLRPLWLREAMALLPRVGQELKLVPTVSGYGEEHESYAAKRRPCRVVEVWPEKLWFRVEFLGPGKIPGIRECYKVPSPKGGMEVI